MDVNEDEVITPFNVKQPVGHWILDTGNGEIVYSMYKKPNWFVRFMTSICFDLRWEDVDEYDY